MEGRIGFALQGLMQGSNQKTSDTYGMEHA
jgi:hypothetical protein